MQILTGLEQITPVEKRGLFFFKRDDLYQPFEVPLNGGKVRQALFCMQSNQDRIREHFSSTVATVSSVHSPQGYLITRCAHSLGFKTIIGLGVGDVQKAIDKYQPLKMARELGAEIISLAKIGYNSVLETRLNNLAREKNYFAIHFGIPFDLSANTRQISNLPDGLDNLVIPCGSGISAASIFRGLEKLSKDKRPKNVYVVQIAGNDRKKVINARMSYHFIADKTYPYSKRVDLEYEGLPFDNVYESKAFDWLQRSKLPGRTLFWVIGNFNAIRVR